MDLPLPEAAAVDLTDSHNAKQFRAFLLAPHCEGSPVLCAWLTKKSLSLNRRAKVFAFLTSQSLYYANVKAASDPASYDCIALTGSLIKFGIRDSALFQIDSVSSSRFGDHPHSFLFAAHDSDVTIWRNSFYILSGSSNFTIGDLEDVPKPEGQGHDGFASEPDQSPLKSTVFKEPEVNVTEHSLLPAPHAVNSSMPTCGAEQPQSQLDKQPQEPPAGVVHVRLERRRSLSPRQQHKADGGAQASHVEDSVNTQQRDIRRSCSPPTAKPKLRRGSSMSSLTSLYTSLDHSREHHSESKAHSPREVHGSSRRRSHTPPQRGPAAGRRHSLATTTARHKSPEDVERKDHAHSRGRERERSGGREKERHSTHKVAPRRRNSVSGDDIRRKSVTHSGGHTVQVQTRRRNSIAGDHDVMHSVTHSSKPAQPRRRNSVAGVESLGASDITPVERGLKPVLFERRNSLEPTSSPVQPNLHGRTVDLQVGGGITGQFKEIRVRGQRVLAALNAAETPTPRSSERTNAATPHSGKRVAMDSHSSEPVEDSGSVVFKPDASSSGMATRAFTREESMNRPKQCSYKYCIKPTEVWCPECSAVYCFICFGLDHDEMGCQHPFQWVHTA